jgi:lauroyl/myristoyl acyltransferase
MEPAVPDRDRQIVTSPLSHKITRDGMTVDVVIDRRETDPRWAFKIVNENGTSFHWPNDFSTDEEALAAAMNAIAAHGIESFRDDAPCPLCQG